MRKVVVGACLAGLLATSGIAAAQQPQRGQAPVVLRRERFGAYGAADAARARARRGDCEGALEAFDEALRSLQDPTLYRDRGLCHERLDHPYPAMDDYRAYLTRVPDAPDADDVRARLERLEEKTGVARPGPRPASESAATSGGGVHVAADINGERYDSAEAERDDDSGPLRNGKGWALIVPFLGVRHWFDSSSLADNSWSEVIGARLGYAVNQTSTWFGELGYERFNAGDAQGITVSGLSAFGGYEARLPIKREDIDNHWLLAVGVTYEHLVVSTSGGVNINAPSLGGLGGRGRFGWRHNFNGSSAFELTLDAGLARFFTYGSNDGSSGSTSAMLGLNAGLVFGL